MRQGKVLQITFCVVILFSCAFFTFLYWNDNKYKNDPNDGIQYLYDNWEFYYGVLLTPEDMKNGDFTEEDLENAKKGIISQINTIDDEQDTQIIYFFGQEITNSNVGIEEYKNNILNVTKEDVIKIASKIKINTIYFLRN